ncbi:hypothetical protein [Gilliamella sp. wkB112]|uniref:hypothetical protein n=1 Tax=Gilliamella sp. wkB112 TaxID=3120257 RepID=UPI00080EC519|nr:hypothetical protein [Gilliamella apicola]OCG00906.1 hypothetical protein A9G12_03625 [Gilliamella apicola]
MGLCLNRGQPRLENGNLKEGWQHIEARHITGSHPNGAGDLFAAGTTRADIEKYAAEIIRSGTRQSDPSKIIQTFTKKLNINGLRANYKLIVDSVDGNRIITMFPMLGGH